MTALGQANFTKKFFFCEIRAINNTILAFLHDLTIGIDMVVSSAA